MRTPAALRFPTKVSYARMMYHSSRLASCLPAARVPAKAGSASSSPQARHVRGVLVSLPALDASGMEGALHFGPRALPQRPKAQRGEVLSESCDWESNPVYREPVAACLGALAPRIDSGRAAKPDHASVTLPQQVPA